MFFNVPNALTLFRIFLVPLLVVILLTKLPAREYLALFVFLLAAITDWLDGYLARKRNEETTLGKLLDPIADKLLMSAAFISLVEVGAAPAWMERVRSHNRKMGNPRAKLPLPREYLNQKMRRGYHLCTQAEADCLRPMLQGNPRP